MSSSRLGAHDAFLLDDPTRFYIVESGYVDLFVTVTEEDQLPLIRKPFIARIMPDAAFFGSRVLSVHDARKIDGNFLAFKAVPSRGAVVLSGECARLAAPDGFDPGVIALIDDWVTEASRFIGEHGSTTTARGGQVLIEADQDVRYGKGTPLSAHHLEVLWARADQPAEFVGRSKLPVRRNDVVPLTEWTSLIPAEDALVSAIHTPGAIVGGWIWDAMDRFNARVLRYGEQFLIEHREQSENRHRRHRERSSIAKEAMIRNLTSLLNDVPAVRHSSTLLGKQAELYAAAAAVAESVGAKLEVSSAPPDRPGAEPLRAGRDMVESAGIRTRQVSLSTGWERRDGPSFLGVLAGEEPRPVAVVNPGGGAYRIIDPASGPAAPLMLNRKLADSLEPRGLVFYPPLPAKVKSGLAALLHVLRPRRRDIQGVILMGCLGAVVALLIPIMTGQLLAEIIPRVDIPMWTAALTALGLGALASGAFSIVGALCMLRIEALVDEKLQAAVWSRLLSLPLPFFGNYLAGDLADRANGVSVIRQVLTGATGGSVLSGIFSAFSYGLLFYYSWRLALWSGTTVLVLAAATWFFATRQVRHNRTAFKAQGTIDGLVFQIIRGIAKLRQANAETHALKQWSEQYAKQKSANLSARKWAAGQLAFNALFGSAVQIVLLGMIWYTLIGGDSPAEFDLADFLSFHAAFGQLVGGVTGLTAAWITVVSVLPLFERIQPILEATPENAEGRTLLTRLAGRVEFRDVSFRYPSSIRDALRDASFLIGVGEYVAFVGPSGAGKSTVYRMMLGFERPTSGTVLVDGHDLATLDLPSMRKHMGVVLQNRSLIPGSVYENIAGELDIDENEIWDALRAVGLEEDINAMPMRLESLLSEAGSGLSGGQKQRLLIARALARKPSILLFDEATSMLDNRTQDTIRNTLRGLNATRVVIAHRLSTVVDVDRIYVLQDGRIVESGSYRELLERDGVMADMARRQLI